MALRLAKPKNKTDAALLAEWTALYGERTARFALWVKKTFKVPSGINRGKWLILEHFQLEFIRDHLSDDPDGGPLFRSAILSTPRKLGKTSLLALLVLGYMDPSSPIFIPGFSGGITAPTENHAFMVPRAALEFQDYVERDVVKLRIQPQPGKLIGPQNGVLHILSGSRSQGHGLSLDLALIDECGLLTRQSEVLTNLFDATAARDGRLIATGTRGDSPAYNDLIDNPDRRTSVHLYGAPLDADVSDSAVWEAANPGLGKIKSRRFMADAYEKAEKSGSTVGFGVWNLNQPLSVSRQLLLEYATVKRAYDENAEPQDGDRVWVGIDLGGSASMTAAVAVYESGAIRCLGAFPNAELDLVSRGKRDLVGLTWVQCAERGELIETSGHVTELTEFLPHVLEMIGPHEVAAVVGDRYRDAELRNALIKSGIHWPLHLRSNGPKDGNADILATRRFFLSGRAKMKRSLLLEASLGESDVKVSTTGALQLDRAHSNGRNDVAMALTLAAGAMLRGLDQPQAEYEVTVL